ncbi:hypothetical protein H671_2g4386 [Cricetulus griseus]|nr:hypothetical protein H671_2g4386 [Cricetulus griseus]
MNTAEALVTVPPPSTRIGQTSEYWICLHLPKETLVPYPPGEQETPATPTRRKDEKRTRCGDWLSGHNMALLSSINAHCLRTRLGRAALYLKHSDGATWSPKEEQPQRILELPCVFKILKCQ